MRQSGTKARRHTKAHEDFAKEEVLDSENGTAARGGSRWRRLKGNRSSGVGHVRHMHSGPTRIGCQPLLAFMNRNGPRRNRAVGSMQLAAGSVRVIARLAAMLTHLITTRMLICQMHAHKTGHCRDRRPKQRDRQHQKSPLSCCTHLGIAPISNLRIADRHLRRRDLDHTSAFNVTRRTRHEYHLTIPSILAKNRSRAKSNRQTPRPASRPQGSHQAGSRSNKVRQTFGVSFSFGTRSCRKMSTNPLQ